MRSFISASIFASLFVPAAAIAQPPPPPPPGYAPTYAAPADPVMLRNGLTFEANLGIGWVWATSDGDESDKELALGGLNLGVGGWINPNLAVTIRAAGVTYSDSEGDTDFRFTTGFFGPSAQYWTGPNFWLGGGLGLGFVQATIDGPGGSDSDSETGVALDLRAGYTFSNTSENTWNVSFELTPSFLELGGQDITFWGMGILLGYQHL